MREGFTQQGANLSLTTPFGAEALLLTRFEGLEALSQPFRFQLSMQASDLSLSAATILGASMTVKMQIPKGPARYFNGICARFVHVGSDNAMALYSAEMVPTLWLLSLSRDRVIYQNLSAAEIIKQVLGQYAVTFDDQLSGSYSKREFCVQYDESALDFISRLMEEEGIFYFHTFTDGSHTLVLADAPAAHSDCAHASKLSYLAQSGGRRRMDTVTQMREDNRLVPQKFALGDYNYLQPSTALLSEVDGALGKGLVFAYPGGHSVLADGKQRAKVQSQASQVQAAMCQGSSHCYALAAGTKFTLSEHPRSTLNKALVLHSVAHSASPTHYSNSFEAFDAAVPYRAPRTTPLPRVSGSQTAIVTGPSGEEIWTDKLGRVKVQFHWDRVGANDDKSSCWVRVAQTWAGKAWGSLFLPRIGQEVVVSFVDGDPDRPLVTASVYNGDNAPPVTLPGMQTQSTIKSMSSKQGSAGNELRMEDKKDSEELYLHAQKDMRVEIENNLSTTLNGGAEVHTLQKGDRTVDVQKGKETHNVQGTRAVTVTGNETHTNKADFEQTVSGKYTLKVTGDLLIDVSGAVTIKAGHEMSTKAGTELTNKAGTALKASAGTTLNLEGLSISSKASASQTVDGGGMLTLKGGMVKIN